MNPKVYALIACLLFLNLAGAQNLLENDLQNWNVGGMPIDGFNHRATSSENSIISSTNPFGELKSIWLASPDADYNADGGWNSDTHNIDHTKDYRFSVWIKKTNSDDGITYFGCWSTDNILRLDGSLHENPYFWFGDLPSLNKWYLLVGYVRGSGYSGSGGSTDGGIYDPTTGQQVVTGTDYKFKNGTADVIHRAYLFYDLTTADKQYFYAPRLEQVNAQIPSIQDLMTAPSNGNLLAEDLQNWSVGGMPVDGFSFRGNGSENSLIDATDPFGESSVIWRAEPSGNGGGDGGFYSSYKNIDHSQKYRFTVWMRKTNSNEGTSYFGLWSDNNITKIDGTLKNNPYFWLGDLPSLNKWYLLVGYVHGSGATVTEHDGGIYDPATGQEVQSITDYKFKSGTPNVFHRAFLYNDTNTNDEQYFFAPRIELVNGTEPTITELLGSQNNGGTVNRLVFVFDTAGNQTIRKIPSQTTTLKARLPQEPLDPEAPLLPEEDSLLANNVIIYPNPTAGDLAMEWSQEFNGQIKDIVVTDMGNKVIKVSHDQGAAKVDLTNYPSGIYLVSFKLTDGSTVIKKIIKK